MQTERRKEKDRRKKFRFPIRREMRFKMLEGDTIVAAGGGETLDIGSGGVAFAADHSLKTGGFIELSISWPVMLNESCLMRLVVFGRVLRSVGRKCVSTVDKYEFRTQARNYQEPAPARSDSMLQRWADGYRKDTLKAAPIVLP